MPAGDGHVRQADEHRRQLQTKGEQTTVAGAGPEQPREAVTDILPIRSSR